MQPTGEAAELTENPSGDLPPEPPSEPNHPGREAATSPSAADPAVSTAFVLGWELASIMRPPPFEALQEGEDEGGLLRLDSLSPVMRAKLTIGLIESSVQKLRGRLVSADQISQIKVRKLRVALDEHGKGEVLGAAVAYLHEDVLFALVAADSKLGRAFALGHELADICLGPDCQASFDKAFGVQVVGVKNRLADLASSFPPHSSRAVVLSLRTWEEWAAEPKLDGKRLNWEQDGAGIKDALARQGRLWRDLLASDKQGRDMLDTEHYLLAASSLIKSMVSTLWRFLSPVWWFLLPLVLALGGGIYLFATGNKLIGVILAALGAIGITGTSVRARLGDVAGQLQSELWGAELDVAIGNAILVGPEGWGMTVAKADVHASGAKPKVGANLEKMSEFREAVAKGATGKIQAMLAPDAKFVREPEAPQETKALVRWLAGLPSTSRIGTQPVKVKAVGPSVLVSFFEPKGADVCRIQEGKIRFWQDFASHADAEDVARELALGAGVKPDPNRTALGIDGA